MSPPHRRPTAVRPDAASTFRPSVASTERRSFLRPQPQSTPFATPTKGNRPPQYPYPTPTKVSRAAPQCSSSHPAYAGGASRSPASVATRSPHCHPSPLHRTCPIASPARHSTVIGPVGGENRKYKTEMCKNMLETGFCRFGENCHYAHSEEERHSPSVQDLMRDDRLLLPCSIMISTGFCPYDHRCKSLHDPRVRVTTYPKLGDKDDVIVLEHCTKAKRSGDVIPDRLYHRHLNSIRQSNPLVAPYVWDTRTTRDSSLEFQDTYNLVCNAGPGVDVYTPSVRRRRTGGGHLYSDVVNRDIPQVMLGELQKLCIVLQMRDKDDSHLDFVYAPKDCLNGQPCMVLQTCYFRLIDISHLQQPNVSADNIAVEVSYEIYHDGKFNNPNFVCAHEVAFDSKGKRSCNLSVWFGAMVTTCSSSKAKKMSKKEDPWRLDDGCGSLFTMPNNDEFEASFPLTTPPYVFMEPVEDQVRGHDLIRAILKHRVATVLLSQGFCVNSLPSQLDELARDFAVMKADLKRWAWPKTSSMDHFSKTKEDQNQTVYSPAGVTMKDNGITLALWRSFVTNLNGGEERADSGIKRRLPVFGAITEAPDVLGGVLPRIQCADHRATLPESDDDPASLSENTWRELLLGEGDGSWKRTIAHAENQRKGAVRTSAAHLAIVTNSLFSR